MSRDTWSKSENVRYLSIFLLLLYYFFFKNTLILIFSIFWTALILIMGNIRHLKYNNKFLYFIRMTLYFLPYSVPALIFTSFELRVNIQVLLYCMLACFLFLIWFLINYKTLKISLSDDAIIYSRKETKYVYCLRIYNSVGAAICEELFFRGFILSLEAPMILLIGFSSLFFMLSHYILPWSDSYGVFTKMDYFYQFIFGLASSVLMILSGSLWPSILLHLLLNTPSIIRVIRSYDRYYIRGNYFESILQEDVSSYKELDI